MRWSEQYPSRYLRAADYENGQAWPLTIERVEREQVVDGEGEKPVLYFVGAEKGLVLNQVNGGMLADLFGDDMSQWPGKSVILRRETTLFNGKRVPAMRLHPLPAAPLAPAPAATAPAAPPTPAPAMATQASPFQQANAEVGQHVPPGCPF